MKTSEIPHLKSPLRGLWAGLAAALLSAGGPALAQVSVDWADVDKTGSSLANLATRSASDLNSGTLPDARFPATLPAISAANLTALNASNLAAGTMPVGRMPALTGGDATTPAGSGAITFGTVNSNTGTFGSATQVAQITLDGKGRATAAANVTITPAWASITGKPAAVDGSTTQGANTFFSGPASGSAAVPAFRALTQADTQAATAANRNALAPRGGLAFDGTSGAKLMAVLTGQVFAADELSFSLFYRVPSSNPSAARGIALLTPSSSGANVQGAAGLYLNASGGIDFSIGDVASSNYRVATVPNIVASYAGKWVHVVGTRSGANVAVYINGAIQSPTNSGPGSFADAITSSLTYLVSGVWSSNQLTGSLSDVSIYNYALTAAKVQAIYENGGAPLEEDKFGTQVLLANEDWNAGANGWSVNGGASVSGGSADMTVSGSVWKGNLGPRLFNKTVRIRFDYTTTQSGNLRFNSYNQVPSFPAANIDVAISGTGVFNQTYPVDGNPSSTFCLQLSANGWLGAIDNLKINYVGAVVHLTCADGLGSQLRDASTNMLHAERTITGTAWTDPRQSGRQTLTYTFSHSAISATAATTTAFLLPPNTVLREVQLDRTSAFNAATTLDIGISGTATKYVTATSVAATGFTQVASSSLAPESASAWTTVYVKKNQATTTGSVTLNFIIEAVGSPTQ